MVKVEHLCKNYCGNTAVDDLSFYIAPGGVTGLLGPNGAGKSTTMRMLTGCLAPSSGSISIGGVDIIAQPLKARKNIGYLPEIPPVYPDMTVSEHLGFVCRLREIEKKSIPEETDRVCQALNIHHVSTRMIRHLSKGYRQRVGFAAALVGNPTFLVLDEPTVGLDPEQVIEIRELIRSLSGKMSILISSHMLSEISCVCDSLIILRQGRLAASGSLEEIEHSVGMESSIELTAEGDIELAEALICAVVPDWDIKRTGAGTGFCSFTASTQSRQSDEGIRNIERQLFCLFADNRDSVKLLNLNRPEKTLEEVFLDIIKQ